MALAMVTLRVAHFCEVAAGLAWVSPSEACQLTVIVLHWLGLSL